MVNRTELDARIVNHAVRITHAERIAPLYPMAQRKHAGARHSIAALLLRVSVWLAPEQAARYGASDAAIA
jgi:hypothetical protein